MINVTKTFFPPIEEFNKQIERIWKNQWLTNRGELVVELEEKIASYLNLKDSKLISNVASVIPHPIAQGIATASRTAGYGQRRLC